MICSQLPRSNVACIFESPQKRSRGEIAGSGENVVAQLALMEMRMAEEGTNAAELRCIPLTRTDPRWAARWPKCEGLLPFPCQELSSARNIMVGWARVSLHSCVWAWPRGAGGAESSTEGAPWWTRSRERRSPSPTARVSLLRLCFLTCVTRMPDGFAVLNEIL